MGANRSGVDLRAVGDEHSDDRADSPDGDHQQGVQQRAVAGELVAAENEAEERRRRQGGHDGDRLRAAPEPVEPSHDEVEREADERRIAQDLVGGDLGVAQLLQVRGDPQLEAEGHEPGADSEDHDDRGQAGKGRAEKLGEAADSRFGRPVGRPVVDHGGAVARHHRPGLLVAAGGQQEPGRLGDPAVQDDEQQPRRQAEQPQDPPRVMRDQGGGQPARDDVGTGDVAADEHHQPAPVAGGNRLRHEGEGDRQHASGGEAHDEAHGQVEPVGRHRPADRGRHEQHSGQQYGCPAAAAVRQPAPQERTDDRAREACQRQEGGGRMSVRVRRGPEAILLGEAGDDERQSRGLHDVDGDGHRHDDKEADVGRPDGGVIQGSHPQPGNALSGAGGLGEKPEGSRRYPDDDQDHAGDHGRIGLHAGQAEVHVAGPHIHRQMEEHPCGHRGDASPKEGGIAVRHPPGGTAEVRNACWWLRRFRHGTRCRGAAQCVTSAVEVPPWQEERSGGGHVSPTTLLINGACAARGRTICDQT